MTNSSISCAFMQDCFLRTLHRDKVQDEEAAHITLPHNTVFLQYSQYSARNVHNPVCSVSYRNRLIPVSCH